MNGNYYQNPIFPEQSISNDSTLNTVPIPNYDRNNLNVPFLGEQSNTENILKKNVGKVVTVYVTVPDSKEWQDKTFKGVIEDSSKNHLIISDHTNGNWHLILTSYITFITFDEPINIVKQY